MTEDETEPTPTSKPAGTKGAVALSAGMQARLTRLTPRQKDCLRLVRPGYPSKMIARDLSVSPLRVDAHVGDAMITLGLNSRFEAARLLRAWEQTEAEATPGVQMGAQSDSLPEGNDLRSDPGVADQAVEMQARPEQEPPAKAREASDDADADAERTTPGRLMRSARHVRVAPSFFAVAVSVAAIAAAIGAVTALLITFDWGGQG